MAGGRAVVLGRRGSLSPAIVEAIGELIFRLGAISPHPCSMVSRYLILYGAATGAGWWAVDFGQDVTVNVGRFGVQWGGGSARPFSVPMGY